MDFQVVWSELAVNDFETVIRGLAERSPAGAETVRQQILDSTAVLSRLPYIGPVYDRDRSGRTREIVCGSYRLFYRVREDVSQVQLLRIWHGSRREPRLPPA